MERDDIVWWFIFGLLILSDWKIALLIWIIPFIFLVGLEFIKGRGYSWDIILTPVINLMAFLALLLGPIIEWIDGKVKDKR